MLGEWSRPTPGKTNTDSDSKPAAIVVTDITLNKTTLTKYIGGAAVTLTATVAPADATDKTLSWSSDNAAVATVNNGEVTITGKGSATITATANDGSDVKATCTINVYNPVLPGKISVSSTKKVYFSMGNLRATYDGTEWDWTFAINQWNYSGSMDGNCKITDTDPFVADYTGSSTTVDLFGWSTAATTYGIRKSETSSIYSGEFVDWGNTMGTGWRTLTSAEWEWILGPTSSANPGTNCRASGSTVNGSANARYAFAHINGGGDGIIVFPDGVTIASDEVISWGNIDAPISSISNYTQCSKAQWAALEAKGCVFLPAAGYRLGTSIIGGGGYVRYWSCSPNGAENAYSVKYTSGNLEPQNSVDRYYGCSVRLVKDVVE